MTTSRAAELLAINGPNSLSSPKKPPFIVMYLKHLKEIFCILLLVAGTLSFIIFFVNMKDRSNLYLGIVLFAIAFFNSGIEFYQVYRTSAILESFKKLLPARADVIREGILSDVSAENLVSGDLVFIKVGQKASADLRVLYASESLKVDNSSITGESEPQERSSSCTSPNPLETSNIIFNGSLIVSGEGIGMVIRVGDKSILGQIAGLSLSEKKRESQLTREVELFVKKMGLIAVFSVVLFIIIAFIMKYEAVVILNSAIGLFVAFIPQGLPLTVTMLLRHAAVTLSKNNVLVKDLHSVETLGSITMLATDKTGTLTQNKMTCVGTWLNGSIFAIADAQDVSRHDKILQKETPNSSLLTSASCLCSKAIFDASLDERQKSQKERLIIGDATESGLLRFASNRIADVEAEREKYPKIYEIPFSSATKWHLTIHRMPTGGYRIYLKGAPERVISMCSTIITQGLEAVTITPETITHFNNAYESFASQGQRVLSFAYMDLSAEDFGPEYEFSQGEQNNPNFPIQGLVFIGLISLMDPPKRGVRKAIASCRTAGIQVVMVTGDHPLTAEAIARKIGIIQGETQVDAAKRLQKPVSAISEEEYDAVVIHGERIASMTDDDWDRVFSKREIVFARTTPQQKLTIVTRGQAKGHIVGVSGDGVNDSPALKKADLGISMNHSASDVSKESAAMILLDDQFVSIIQGIHLGRVIFANLKKSIRYTLTHSIPEIAAFFVYIFLTFPPLVSSMLILFIDLGTELLPAISYAWEPAEKDLMLVPPSKVLCANNKNWGSFQRESEAVAEEHHSFFGKLWLKLKATFIRKETGEVLVDNDMLIWCYLEGGVIIFCSCFGAFLLQMFLQDVPMSALFYHGKRNFIDGVPFTLKSGKKISGKSESKNILNSAQTAYFISIVIGQWFNVFLQKHRYQYPWGWDMFVNVVTYVGIALGVAICVFIMYVPFMHEALSSYHIKPMTYLVPVAAGVFLFGYEVIRRFLRKRGWFGGVPKKNQNLVELIRTTSTVRQ